MTHHPRKPSANTDFARYLPDPGNTPWGMRVLAGGRNHIPPGVPYPLAGHPEDHALRWPRLRIIDEYQYILITRGRGRFRSEATGEVHIATPCVLLLFPGIGHCYHPDIGTGWDEPRSGDSRLAVTAEVFGWAHDAAVALVSEHSSVG